ncbi:hypothetical protein BJ878DRAFT_487566 [Calycina marina]|uniref:Embryonic stem cell-specific 5-hydroxymethylcytosine-binding protein n=1 Tax=Calycina marina TaxID=1763456 RepID=A0A9P7ZBY1_9HELO|nr:hypothetical protein BJ878DRAFT_487566 [Calycina marina]
MCGRYSLALRPSQVRSRLVDESNMPVYDAPEDEGEDAPRQSYNFAPGYRGIVYRAETLDTGAGPSPFQADTEDASAAIETSEATAGEHDDSGEVQYKLQTMKWGLVPFWTKRNPDYGSLMKTINCRDDSLFENRGMWTTMKQRKRCIVVAQGFYEWMNKGKQKVPHYIKRKDGQLMCAAGLWDCVQYEGEGKKLYTYTIITTLSNKQLNFLHDRMPVILDNGSDDLKTWLDPKRHTWSKELQSLLKSFEGELEIYPVSRDVGKVGNNSPNFIIPVASSENKSNIANFFTKPKEDGKPKLPSSASKETSSPGKNGKKEKTEEPTEVKSMKEEPMKKESVKQEPEESHGTIDHTRTEDNAPLPVPIGSSQGIKRELDNIPDEEPPSRMQKRSENPTQTAIKTRSATSNAKASRKKALPNEKGTQRITSFFRK